MSASSTSEPRPIELGKGGTDKRQQYYEFECIECGKEARNTYCEPYRTRMLERRLCFTCNYWQDFKDESAPKAKEITVIDGHVYSPGNRTTGSFRGMAGRRFDIEYIDPSIFAGQRITTFDLWSGSVIPDHLRPLFPDTARFLGGAEKADASGTTCWNPSEHGAPAYPLPSSLKPNAGPLAKAERQP